MVKKHIEKHIKEWDKLEFVRNWNQTPVLQIDIRDGEVRNDLVVRKGSVPIDVYNGLVLEFYIPKSADPTRIVATLKEGAWDDLFERIIAGATVWWDGSNHRWHLNEDAADAAYELEQALDKLRGHRWKLEWRYRNMAVDKPGVTQIEILRDDDGDEEVVAIYEYGYHGPSSSDTFEALYLLSEVSIPEIAACLDTWGEHSLRGRNKNAWGKGKPCLVFTDGNVYYTSEHGLFYLDPFCCIKNGVI